MIGLLVLILTCSLISKDIRAFIVNEYQEVTISSPMLRLAKKLGVSEKASVATLNEVGRRLGIETSSAPEKPGLDPFGYPKVPINNHEIADLISQHQFDQLNTLLDNYQKEFEHDFRQEYKIMDACRVFQTGPSEDEEKFYNQWVEKYPALYQPYLARAFYYRGMANESRGTKWAKDTPQENFKRMEIYGSNADQDAVTALQKNPGLAAPYVLLLWGRVMGGGSHTQMRAIVDQALKVSPYSIAIRYGYMEGIKPRWGGSYEMMERFAEESEKMALIKNPRIAVIRGMIEEDKGDVLWHDKKYKQSLKSYSNALQYGEESSLYEKRAKLHARLQQYGKAFNDLARAIELRPGNATLYLSRADLLSGVGRITEAKRDQERAIELNPRLPEVKKIQAQDNVPKYYP